MIIEERIRFRIIPGSMKKRVLEKILKLFMKGEFSAGRAAKVLGRSRAKIYELLNQWKLSLPEKLSANTLKELNTLE